jgi:hypothetical protein
VGGVSYRVRAPVASDSRHGCLRYPCPLGFAIPVRLPPLGMRVGIVSFAM